MFKACVAKQSCQVPGGSQTKLFVLRLREICVAILTHVSVSFLIMFAPVQILGQHTVSQGVTVFNLKPFLWSPNIRQKCSFLLIKYIKLVLKQLTDHTWILQNVSQSTRSRWW